MGAGEKANPVHTVEVTDADGRVLRFTGYSRACKESHESFCDDSAEYVAERVVDAATGEEVDDWSDADEGLAWIENDEAEIAERWAIEQMPRVYTRCALGRDRKALAVLFEIVDDLLSARLFDECDRVASAVDLARLDATCLVGLLTITFAAREHLPSRPALYERVRAWLRTKLPNARVERVIKNLV